jgi:hypothetical protein
MYFAPPADHIVAKLVDEEVIVINLLSGVYFSMEGAAAKIWRDLYSGISRDALEEDARQAFPDCSTLHSDFDRFFGTLVADGLLVETANRPLPAEELEAMSWPSVYTAPGRMSFDDVAEMVALDPPLPELQTYGVEN